MLPFAASLGGRRVLQRGLQALVLAALLATGPAQAQLADAPWSSFGRDLQNTGQSAFGGAAQSWQDVSVGTAQTGASIASDGTIYVSGGSFGNAALYALNPDSTERWRFDPGGLNARSIQPLVGPNGTVYIGGEDANSSGLLYAVNPTTGAEEWQFRAPGAPVRVAPALAVGGTIYVAGGSFFSGGQVDAVDLETGNAMWSVSLNDYPTASVTIADDGTVYVGTTDGTVHAIDPVAQEASVFAAFSGAVQGIAIDPGGTMYVTHGNQLSAIELATGNEQWSVTTDLFSLTPPAVGPNGRIFVGAAGEVEGQVYAFSSFGTEVWSINTTGLVDAVPAVGADGAVHVSVSDGGNSRLLVLDPATGTQQWFVPTEARLSYPPALAADRTVYLASAEGLFSVLGPRIGLPASPLSVGRVEDGGSKQQQVAVVNTGDAPLTIAEVTLSGPDASAFAIVDGAGPVTLPPGDEHVVTVRFAPDGGGAREAELTVQGNAPSAAVTLTGRAISIDLDPTQLATPRVGEPLDFSIALPTDFMPQTRSFFYRPTGTEAYQEIDLQPAGDGSVLEGTIPGTAVTVRGIDYYASLAAEDLTLTFPVDNPAANPAWLPVQFDQLVPGGVFEPEVYRMISIPAELAERDLATVFDEYGAYEPSRWRVIQWDPQAETYSDLPDLEEASVAPGQAFWLITRDGEPFTVGGGAATEASSPYDITLQPGWNQIGNPFAFPVRLERIDWPAEVEDPVRFDGQAFQRDVQVLQPWAGYFVYNTAVSAVTLSIPPIEAAGAAASRGLATASAADPAATMRLSARLPKHGLSDRNNIAGLARGSEAGRDRMDYAEPPPVGDHVRLSIIEGDERLAGSFKPFRDTGQWWDLELTASVDEPFATRKQVRIRLQPEGPAPDGFERFLIDRDTETALSLDEGAATLVLSSDRPTRRLRVIWGTPDFAAHHAEGASLDAYVNALHPNAPNPFAESTTIRYELRTPGRAVVAIYNLLGQRVRTLVDTRKEAGRHVVSWDGRDARGRPVASGVYFSRLRAGSYEAIQKLTLVR
ncbi:MAG: PQQ-binding-like beta-propeller repeat protein [Bacteroidetes bacterium]|jgi:outer membrane protein assembly factor BamB|nr:PQQ-binding-like beta-propeller repeat protein [Bacteroidota bacterium]